AFEAAVKHASAGEGEGAAALVGPASLLAALQRLKLIVARADPGGRAVIEFAEMIGLGDAGPGLIRAHGRIGPSVNPEQVEAALQVAMVRTPIEAVGDATVAALAFCAAAAGICCWHVAAGDVATSHVGVGIGVESRRTRLHGRWSRCKGWRRGWRRCDQRRGRRCRSDRRIRRADYWRPI